MGLSLIIDFEWCVGLSTQKGCIFLQHEFVSMGYIGCQCRYYLVDSFNSLPNICFGCGVVVF